MPERSTPALAPRRWPVLFGTRAYEREPGFRAEIQAFVVQGMVLAAGLGLAGVGTYMLAQFLAGKAFVWSSSGLGVVVLWDKAVVVGVSLAMLALSRTEWGVRHGRAVVTLCLFLAAVALVGDDVARADLSFTPGWLALILLVGVGTVPYQPWQTLVLCLSVSFLFILGAVYATSLFEGANLAVGSSRVVFLLLLTFLCTSISAFLYNSRYYQYRALREVEELTGQLGAHTTELGEKNDALAHANSALERSLRDLEEAQDRLVQSEKLASLGQLTAGVAHEIKNPLNFVTNFARLSVELAGELREVLETQPERPVSAVLREAREVLDDLTSNAQRIREHSERADRIVQSMLLHSRGVPGEARATDLNALLEEYAHLAYHGMRAADQHFNVTLEADLDPEVGTVTVQPGELGRVLINLLHNAFYAVNERAIQMNGAYAPTVAVRSRAANGDVRIEVMDNGTGIPEELRERVFEPFFTTKPAGAGTGLGLSLAYEVVTQRHGGTIEVQSEEGRGTTFTITLPRRTPTA